jgi:4'-phosphopantetheinyl transferase EntD
VYKAQYPLTHGWLDFSHVAITIDVTAGTFRVRPLDGAPEDSTGILKRLSGRFLVRDRLVVSAVFLPQGA